MEYSRGIMPSFRATTPLGAAPVQEVWGENPCRARDDFMIGYPVGQLQWPHIFSVFQDGQTTQAAILGISWNRQQTLFTVTWPLWR